MGKPAHSDTPNSATAVELREVTKTYRQRVRPAGLQGSLRALLKPTFRAIHALRGVDLNVERGETLAYAGPNGAGKSTTIKLLAGILAPDSGVVRVLGLDPVKDRRRHVSRIGVVFGQRTELWQDHPVGSSYEWKRVVWNIEQANYDRMLGVVTELLDLGDILPALTRELSLGQRMRAELGLALLHEPQLLLLDEPTIGLDVLGKRRILQFVKELRASQRVTTVVTSHDMADLEVLAERVVMIDRGTLSFDGGFRELRAQVNPRRILTIETAGPDLPPALADAELTKSEGSRHTFLYDPRTISIGALLEQAAKTHEVLDVETHRPDIDEVIADLYAGWQDARAEAETNL
ncbi:MAG TPA: ATP-binding cassette domain-containing protein [Acidimicrobiales bacterium]|nr:ATP-binding cassette domain-containing protein [Acidimicrobiales bacterium]